MPAKRTWKGEELSLVSNSLGPVTWAQLSLWREFRCLSERPILTQLLSPWILLPFSFLFYWTIFIKNSWLSWLKSEEKDTFVFQHLHQNSSDDTNALWGQVWWLQDLRQHGAYPGGTGEGAGRGSSLGWAPSHWLGSSVLEAGSGLSILQQNSRSQFTCWER